MADESLFLSVRPHNYRRSDSQTEGSYVGLVSEAACHVLGWLFQVDTTGFPIGCISDRILSILTPRCCKVFDPPED
jgi:hypothetical protein